MSSTSRIIVLLSAALWFSSAQGARMITDSDGSVEVVFNESENVTVKRCDDVGKCVTVYSNNSEDRRDRGRESAPDAGVLGIEFVRFEAGRFVMGSPKDEKGRDGDEDQVTVTLTRPFEMATREVTQRQWFEMMDTNPSRFSKEEYCGNDYIELTNAKGKKVGICPDHPVERVSLNEVQEFLRKLNQREGVIGCGSEDGHYAMPVGCYRLPTEAEWEYAVRAGTKTRYSFGDDENDLKDYGWYDGNANEQTHPVGLKTANPKGLHDVHGNVDEWVHDWYDENLRGWRNPLQKNPTSRGIVVRGGNWKNKGVRYLRSANRHRVRPAKKYDFVGFRLVRQSRR